jgi:DNA-binding beta-propeller fold protein YncE
MDNDRIQVFDSNGNFITMWGTSGTGDGQFKSPSGIAVDSSSGNVYVAENTRIQVFDSNSNFVLKWGSNGTEYGQFDGPEGVAVDSSSGNVYVVDNGNDRIQVFAVQK